MKYWGWASQANYNASLLCYPQGRDSISTGECAYLWSHASWENGDTGHTTYNGLPTAGRKCVNSVVVGCDSRNRYSSARTVICSTAVSDGEDHYAGRFSIPHLQL